MRTMIEQAPSGATCVLIRLAVAYGKQGAPQQEAAVRFLKAKYLSETGQDASNQPFKHYFKHWIDACADAEGFEP